MYVAYKRKTDNQLLIYESDHYFNGTTDVVVAVQGKYPHVNNPYKAAPEDSEIKALKRKYRWKIGVKQLEN